MYLSLYIHIPVCISKCLYCDFFSLPLKETASFFSFKRFAPALLNEIRTKAKIYGASGFSTVYIGGGSPSLIPPQCVSSLCSGIRSIHNSANHGLAGNAPPIEWTVEMNPCDVTAEKLKAWNEGGANRLSLGIQSCSDKTLSALGRRGNNAQNIEVLSLASAVWKGDISVDLIAGLPFQSALSLRGDISAILAFKPAHVSLYQLAIEKNTPLYTLNAKNAMLLPSEDEAAEIWNAGKDMLMGAGFSRYEVSNFALPYHESRHNMAYWRINSFIGAGPGASGTLVSGNRCIRFENEKNIEKWLLFWENRSVADDCALDENALNNAPMRIEKIEPKDFAFETLMMGMRLAEGIKEEDFRVRFSAGLDECFGGTIKKWERVGRLKAEGGCVFLTEEGLLFLNAFLVECFGELSQKDIQAFH